MIGRAGYVGKGLISDAVGQVRGIIFIDQETSGFWDWKCLAK